MSTYAVALLTVPCLFLYTNHPLMLAILIMTQTTIMCSLLVLSSSMNWFSYLLFMIFFGGLMVMFIYVASLSSNNLTTLMRPRLMLATGVALISIILIWTYTPVEKEHWETSYLNNLLDPNYQVTKTLYNWALTPMSTFTLMYLLFVLIVIVHISTNTKGPIRSNK